MSRPAASLRLSIELGSEPIAGSLSLQGGEPKAFCGWIELVEAIESARSEGSGAGFDAPAARDAA